MISSANKPFASPFIVASPTLALRSPGAGEICTPRDIGNEEGGNSALVRGCVAVADRAGSVGGAYKINMSSLSAGEKKETDTEGNDGGGSTALVRGRVAVADRAGSVGGTYKLNMSTLSASEAKETFGAREAEDDDTEGNIAVKAAIVLSSAKTMVSNAIHRLFKQRKENVRIAETEMKQAHVASMLKAEKEEAWTLVHYGRSNRNHSSTGNDAGRGATTATGGTGSGIDELPTREEDDVVAVVDGAGKKGSKAAKGAGGGPRPASAALASGGSKGPEVAVGPEAATAASSVDSVDVEACRAGSDSSSVVKKVMAGLVLLFVVAMLALSGAGFLRCTSSSSLGETGGMSAPAASSYAAAGSQVVKAKRAGAADAPAAALIPADGPATLFGGSKKNDTESDTAAFESGFGGESRGLEYTCLLAYYPQSLGYATTAGAEDEPPTSGAGGDDGVGSYGGNKTMDKYTYDVAGDEGTAAIELIPITSAAAAGAAKWETAAPAGGDEVAAVTFGSAGSGTAAEAQTPTSTMLSWADIGWHCFLYLLPKYLPAVILAIMVAIESFTEGRKRGEKCESVRRKAAWFLVVLAVFGAGGGGGGRGTVVGEWELGSTRSGSSGSSGERGGVSSVVGTWGGGGGRGQGFFAIGGDGGRGAGGASMGRRLVAAMVVGVVGGGGWLGVEAGCTACDASGNCNYGELLEHHQKNCNCPAKIKAASGNCGLPGNICTQHSHCQSGKCPNGKCCKASTSCYGCDTSGNCLPLKICTASTCCNVVIPTLDPLKLTKIAGATGSKSYQCSTSELAAGTCGVCTQGKCLHRLSRLHSLQNEW